MSVHKNLIPVLILTALITILSACGGSSDNSSSTNNPIIEGKPSIISLDNTFNINQGVELLLYYPDGNIENIQWQQTSGAAVPLLSSRSKVISFTPSESGQYSFNVSFTADGNQNKTLSTTIDVSADVHKITARLSHAVISGNKVSLRVTVADDIDQKSILWQQISGPSIDLINTDNTANTNANTGLAVFFNSPVVSQDTIITFKVSASANGITYTDQVAVLVEAEDNIASNAYFENRVAKVFPYNSESPYKNTIVPCVYSNKLTSSCTLATLPLIATESTLPTVENIMDRVVVSHQWMGDRFQDFIKNEDVNDDFKRLLRATTAIVISYDIRPSFYWAATGAIYLDANNFWLTPEERDTINEAPDYRASFGNDLQFVMPWRYVKNNNYASKYFAAENRVTRTANDALYRLVSLMYHELAHANDFFPSNEWASHQSHTRILDAATSTNFESDSLSITYPLQSQVMKNLAQVSFAGTNATSTQKSYLPSDIESFFSTDVATDYYAYSSKREDYAMLFEELMMQSRYGISRDVAITNQPTGNTVSATDYIVTWGQRGRIGMDSIKPRINFSASRVLPEFDSVSALNNVPKPINMTTGDNWIENLPISPSRKMTKPNIANALLLQQNKAENEQQALAQPVISLPYFHKALPKG